MQNGMAWVWEQAPAPDGWVVSAWAPAENMEQGDAIRQTVRQWGQWQLVPNLTPNMW
jgi:hypothetical protein